MTSITELRHYRASMKFPRRVVLMGDSPFTWMTAVMLVNRLEPLQIKATVCPGQQTATDRAFASTPALSHFLRNLGIDEHDMMRSCQGTYRLATQFSDWAHEGRDFWLPVGQLPVRIAGHELFDVWLNERKAGRLLRPLHSYAAHWTASLAGKSPHSFAMTSAFAETGAYGFHGDVSRFSEWLKQVAIQSGVEELPGAIQYVFRNGRGGVAQVKLDSGQAVPGDLFLDFRPDTTSKQWRDESARFVCNRIAQCRQPANRQVAPFTRISGMPGGWLATIPLATQTDYAYAFSSDLHDDAQAQSLMQPLLAGQPSSTEVDIAFRDVSHGAREVFWKDNVVSLGAAACQLEAFAGADMHLHHAGIELFMELFPDRSIGRATREEFNRRMAAITSEFFDFVHLHHVLTSSRNTPYGQHMQQVECSDRMEQLLAIYDEAGVVAAANSQSPSPDQYRWLLAGASRLPARPSLSVSRLIPGELQNALRSLVKHNESIVKDLPLHEEILDWIHSGPFQQLAG